MKFLHSKLTLITSLSLIVFAMSAGVLLAQLWDEPPTAPPALEGDDATPGLNVLFSGQTLNTDVGCATGPGVPLCGGGEMQRRSGALTIGSALPVGTADELTVVGEEVISDQLKVGEGEFLPSTFGTAGAVVSDPDSMIAYDIAIDIGDNAMYLAGSASTSFPADWRVEKRNLITGALDTTFGDPNPDGVATSDPTANEIYAIAIDDDYLYAVGYHNDAGYWIEKRNLVTGALCSAAECDDLFGGQDFDYDGQISGFDAYFLRDVAIDDINGHMYIVGDTLSNTTWIEKRRSDTGARCSSVAECGDLFGGQGGDPDGVIEGGNLSANSVAIDDDYMYVAINAGNTRIEKHRKDTGALCTAGNCPAGDFGYDLNDTFTGSGAVDSHALSWNPTAIVIDATYMYVVGVDDNDDWRIEKRRLSDGALCTAAFCGTEFGTNGVVASADGDTAFDISIDGTNMYVVGMDSAGGFRRIEKRLLSTGALVTNFGTNGVVQYTSVARNGEGIAIDASNMYVTGWQSSGDTDWLTERLSLASGASLVESASVAAFSSDGYAIYGETLDATYSGIHGTTAATSDGKGVWGFTGEAGGYAIYSSSAQNNIAIHGLNPVSWAGYFTGKVEIVNGTFFAEDATFSNDVQVLGAGSDVTVDGAVTIGGIDIKKVNALSLQDQMSNDPPNDSGLQFLTLETANLADGFAYSWEGATTGITDTDLITSVIAVYRESNDDQANWRKYPINNYPNLVNRQCNGGVTWVGGEVDNSQLSVYGLAEDDEGNMYTGSNGDGNVYQSTDDGLTWTNTGDLAGATVVWAIIFASDGALYAGTNNSSVFKSVDKGQNWVAQNLLGSIDVLTLMEDSTGTIWAGGHNGYLFWTDDGGTIWNRYSDLAVPVGQTHNFLEDEVGNLYAGTAGAIGNPIGEVYKSVDGGTTWVVTSPLAGTRRIQALAQDDNLTIYAAAGTTNTHVWRTFDKGVTWEDTGGPIGVDEVDSLWVASTGDIYAGTSNLGFIFRSSDSGTTWANIGLNPANETVELFEDERGYLYACSGNFVRRTGAPIFLPDTAGSVAVKNNTGVEADFRIMATYIPGVNTCP
ncbi:WD40/YVTN/BNR-like repeat-containing protein [Patescibacteria group bacterium]